MAFGLKKKGKAISAKADEAQKKKTEEAARKAETVAEKADAAAARVSESAKRAGRKKKPAAKKTKKRSNTWSRAAFAILVTLAVIAVGFFLVMRDQGNVSLTQNAVGSVFAPIQNALSSATRYVRDVVQGAKNYVKIQQDYELAKREIDNLKLQLQTLEEESRENERLKALLGAKQQYSSVNPLFAQVIARNPGMWMDTFTINRGTQDGVAVNMAVVTGDGLVGRVLEVGLNYAKVLSVIDTRSSISCLIERTRETGVMRGEVTSESQSQECYMYYLPSVNNITPGDVVLTAGDDSLFPKGLKVGTVASISRQTDMSDQYIVVIPSVDFMHTEEVIVLRTLVEGADSQLAPLPTPTPRPTPEPTPTPEVEQPEPTDPDSEIFYWPSPTPGPGEEVLNAATPTPGPTIDPNGPVEDAWTQ